MSNQKPSVFGREPVMWLAIVQTGLALAAGFGLHLTGEQIALIMAFSAAVLGFVARSQVTPTETLPDVSVVPVDREDLVTDAIDQLERASRT